MGRAAQLARCCCTASTWISQVFGKVDKRDACAKLAADVLRELTMTPASGDPPPVTQQDLRQVEGPAVDLDADAFARQLQAFVRARLDSASQAANGDLAQVLAGKAAALQSDTRWTPGATEVQRGRAIMMDAFHRSSNIPLQDFAALAGKSRQQIYKDIDARLLLALNVGSRGQRLPDWQLDHVKRQLTQKVLSAAGQVDEWTVYLALSQPLDDLGGRAPVDAVTADSVEAIAGAVINALGLQAH